MALKFWIQAKTATLDAIRNFAYRHNYEVTQLSEHDVAPHYREFYDRVRPFTMTSLSRIYSVIASVEHVLRNRIPGSFVECGVWKGGSTMAALLAFKHNGDTSREAYLFDTFEGMVAPGQFDGAAERNLHSRFARQDGGSDWCRAVIDEVRSNVATCGYPMAHVHLVQGKVEDTVPEKCPPQISVLRLDTDWYESTKHELNHLYPRVVPGGIVIIDDYGAWAGARRAVDEYLAEHHIQAFLHRIDTTGRMFFKP